jgi:hypothetical protein
MVTMVLIDPSSDEVIRNTIPTSHHVCPIVAMSGDEEADQHDHAADDEGPVAQHVELRERHVGRADLQRHEVVAEAADRKRYHAEENHHGAVHGPELVVELGEHDAVRRVRLAEQAAQDGDWRHRVRELVPQHHHQREAEEQEQQRCDGILDADDLVVE